MTGPKPKPPRPRPWETGNGEASSFGGWLRRQREARDIALREVAEASKINIRYLEALEEDRFEALPAPVFAKGFLREYARYVGLNPDEVVNSYLAALQAHDGDIDTVTESPRRRGGADWAWGLLLSLGVLLLLGAVALLAFYAERHRDRPPAPSAREAAAPVPVAPVTEPLPTAPAPSAPLGAGAVAAAGAVDPGVRVSLAFDEDCWVESKADGAPIVSELRLRGDSTEILAERVVLLTLGNARGVRVEVNGQAFALPPPGRDGSVREVRIEAPPAAAPAAPLAAPAPGPTNAEPPPPPAAGP